MLIPYKKHFPELKDYPLKELNSCLFLFGAENTKRGDLIKEEANKLTREFEQKIREGKGKGAFRENTK